MKVETYTISSNCHLTYLLLNDLKPIIAKEIIQAVLMNAFTLKLNFIHSI